MSGSVETFLGFSGDVNFKKILEDLTKVEVRYSKKLLSWQSEWKARSDAFKQVRLQLMELNATLIPMRSVDNFLKKNTVSSVPGCATAVASGKSIDGTYNLEVKQLASNSVWSYSTGLADKSAVINSTEAGGKFVYTYKGETHEVKIPIGTTLEGMKNLINNHSKNPGVKANLIQSSSGIILQIRGMHTGADAVLSLENSSNIPALTFDTVSKWNAQTNSATLNQAVSNKAELLNPTGPDKTFVFNYDGKVYSIDIDNTMDWDGLCSAVNTKVNRNIASMIPDGSNFKFTLSAPNETVPISAGSDLTTILNTDYEASSSEVHPATASTQLNLQVTIDGQNKTITLDPGATLNTLVSKLNELQPGIAKTTVVGDKIRIALESSVEVKHSLSISDKGTLDTTNYVPPKSDAWLVQNGQNALLRVNGIPREPDWLEVTSNTITDAIEGMTFNLHATGNTVISVNTDFEKIQESVMAFVDGINKVRSLLNELTYFDKDKTVADLKYAKNQFDMQKGSILTGNYGIQLLSSMLKQAAAGPPPGFVGKQDGIVAWDVYSSLSQIGILTEAEEGSDSFGLLKIKTAADDKGPTFMEALKNDPEAVVNLFCANSVGKSNSPDKVGYASHISSITQPGTYKVTYSVDSSGNITAATINGKAATIDNTKKTISLGSGDKNDADGIILDIYNLEPTAAGAFHEATVSIQSGKINEIYTLLSGGNGKIGVLNTRSGTLKLLENRYAEIMKNIQDKIVEEDARLDRWEKKTRLRFARLEATLKYYNSINEGLKNQIKQLSGGGNN